MILSGLVLSGLAPFRVPGRAAVLDVAGQELKRGGSVARLQKLDFALRAFFLTYGARPDSLGALVSERLVDAEDLRDAYGVSFRYDRRAESVTLFAVSETRRALPDVHPRAATPQRGPSPRVSLSATQ